MEKPDETDLRILAALDANARSNIVDIAKMIGLSTHRVNHRIKDMEESGIIKGYTCIPDLFRLGYQCYRIYLRLQHANSSSENEMMDHLCKSQLTSWCGYASGKFDIAAFVWFNAHGQAVGFWEEFMQKYRPYVREAVLVPYCGDTQMCLPFSAGKNIVTTGMEGIQISQKDREILRVLTTNGRASLESVGKAAGLEPASAKYRMDKLIEKKVIKSFRADIDVERLGYRIYKVDFHLSSLRNKKGIEGLIMTKPAVSNILRTIGWADLELQVYAKSSKELNEVLHEIRDEFTEDIQDYDFFEYSKKMKDDWTSIILDAGNQKPECV